MPPDARAVLRQLAVRCRARAAKIPDKNIAAELRGMAEEFEQMARLIR